MQKEIQTIVIPIVKGAPITIILSIIAMLLAAKMVSYAVPEYQSSGSLKIDNRNINLGDLALFEEEGRTKGVTSVDFLTEVEMFRSKRLKELTFLKLDFEVDYFRIGEIKTKELFNNNPFFITYQIHDTTAYDHLYYLKYQEAGRFLWSKDKAIFPPENQGKFKDTLHLPKMDLVVFPTATHSSGLKMELKVGQVFAFRINSTRSLISSINESNFFVRSVDEKIQIVKFYFQHEVPEKAALFVNALMEAYIDYCKEEHQREANKTLEFIDAELASVKKELRTAEGDLVKFKTQKNIMNIKQETDATLKELMQLEFQKVNYNIQEIELQRTFDYLAAGNDLKNFAPNFEGLSDPIFRNAFLKIKSYEAERKDLLQKYTERSDEVQNIDEKIRSTRTFIHESVKNALDNISLRRAEMEKVIAEVTLNIQAFPDKEQQIAILQRELKLNESVYTTLIEKRMEIAVAKSANTVFHQIVDRAEISKSPISPNKPLIYGVAIFFALLTGIALSFLKHFLYARIKSKRDLMQVFSAPILGGIQRVRKGQTAVPALGNLYTNLEILINSDNGSIGAKTVLISSISAGEGKSFTSYNLARLYAKTGKKVLIIDFNSRDSRLYDQLGIRNEGGLVGILRRAIKPRQAALKTKVKNLDMIPTGEVEDIYGGILYAPGTTSFISSLKENYDIILLDTPALGTTEDLVLLMRQVDYSLLVFKIRKTQIRSGKRAESLLEEYKIPNLYAVLNGLPVKGKRKAWMTSFFSWIKLSFKLFSFTNPINKETR
ncbi:MAG: GumC family protein [Saprospiraceae bacterium]